MRYVIFRGVDEVIVCAREMEAETVRVYFTEGGRFLENYDREEANEEAIVISARLTTRC